MPGTSPLATPAVKTVDDLMVDQGDDFQEKSDNEGTDLQEREDLQFQIKQLKQKLGM